MGLMKPIPSTSPAPSFAAILFDLDGTLVRTFIDFDKMREAVKVWATQKEFANISVESDDVLEIIANVRREVYRERGSAAAVQAEEEGFSLLAALEYTGCEKPEAIDGASELLRTLQSCGVRIGIVTRNDKVIASELLLRMDLPYDTLVARGDTVEFKPHPQPILKACENLGVAPENCAVVGDLWADIASGKAAGVARTVGIHWPYDGPNRFAKCPPDVTVSRLREAFPHLLGTPSKAT
jgi:HAD superfamily hydrolase (TIGR01549 family)